MLFLKRFIFHGGSIWQIFPFTNRLYGSFCVPSNEGPEFLFFCADIFQFPPFFFNSLLYLVNLLQIGFFDKILHFFFLCLRVLDLYNYWLYQSIRTLFVVPINLSTSLYDFSNCLEDIHCIIKSPPDVLVLSTINTDFIYDLPCKFIIGQSFLWFHFDNEREDIFGDGL